MTPSTGDGLSNEPATEVEPDSQAGSSPGPCGEVGVAAESAWSAAPSEDAEGNTTTFEAENLVDGRMDTAWRTPGDGRGAEIIFTFESPCTLGGLSIANGYQKTDPSISFSRWQQNRRVATARLYHGGVTTAVVLDTSIEDGFEQIPLVPTTVDSVTLTVTSSFPATKDRDFTAVSEVRFR